MLPYSLKRDLVPVPQIASTAFIALVPSSLPVKTVPELIVLARSRPGKINFGSGGSGTPPTTGNSPDVFFRAIDAEISKWGRAVRDSGGQVQVE